MTQISNFKVQRKMQVKLQRRLNCALKDENLFKINDREQTVHGLISNQKLILGERDT